MIDDAAMFRITADEVDEEIGDGGEDDEDEELSHGNDSKREVGELHFVHIWS